MAAVLCTAMAGAQQVDLTVQPENGALADRLQRASATVRLAAQGDPTAEQVIAAARSDYANLLQALYGAGYFGGTVSIRVDGREAADLSVFAVPQTVGQVRLAVSSGPLFQFGRVAITPQAPGAATSPALQPGATAEAQRLVEASQAAVEEWRQASHAKATVAAQDIVADHRSTTLDAVITLDPGPALRFGTLRVDGADRSREAAIRRIADLPLGAPYQPRHIADAVRRLRATGAYSSVALTEADTVRAPDLLDLDLALVEAPLRRIGAGAEVESDDGLTLSAFWLHRNLFGGAERLRFDASIANIGASPGSTVAGLDYHFGARFLRPASLGADTNLVLTLDLDREVTAAQTSTRLGFGAGFERRLSETLTGSIGLEYLAETTETALVIRDYRVLSLPVIAGFDTRNPALSPRAGSFLRAEVTPFIGQLDAGSGLRTGLDLRHYRQVGTSVVLAARGQWGAVFGPSLAQTPSDFLFLSGGSGTVRGHPFESLGTSASGAFTGGRSFAALSLEARVDVTDTIGVVGFVDAAFVGPNSLPDAAGASHAGYGLGLRYTTPIGPLRLDVALPSDASRGPSLYLGIGQSF